MCRGWVWMVFGTSQSVRKRTTFGWMGSGKNRGWMKLDGALDGWMDGCLIPDLEIRRDWKLGSGGRIAGCFGERKFTERFIYYCAYDIGLYGK